MRLIPAALALLAAAAAAQTSPGPQCPGPGSGGQSTNWGTAYREHAREVFDAVRPAAGVTQPVDLLYVNDLNARNRSARMVNGTPLGAVSQGTEGLPHDTVFYTMGVFELACDKAQLAFFMAHEMRHIKKGPDGKSHLDRLGECTKGVFDAWSRATDLSAYPTTETALAAFHKAKDAEVQTRCVRPLEEEADAFAFDLAPKLPWKVEDAHDPGRDARVQAFKSAERWLDALGERPDDPGHGSAGERAKAAYGKVLLESLARQKAAEERARQSLPR